MWIPLDIILTMNITLYQIFFNKMQQIEDSMDYDHIKCRQDIKNFFRNKTNLIKKREI